MPFIIMNFAEKRLEGFPRSGKTAGSERKRSPAMSGKRHRPFISPK